MGAGAGSLNKYNADGTRGLARKPSMQLIVHSSESGGQRRSSTDLLAKADSTVELTKHKASLEPHERGEYQVYLAYAAGKDCLGRSMKERVGAIYTSLLAKGLVVWFDADKTTACSKMIEHGILHSNVVVVFLTRAYMNQVNSDGLLDTCQHEFSLALSRQTMSHIVLCVMEEDMRRYDSLAGEWRVLVGDSECLDFTDESLLELACNELAEKILHLDAHPDKPDAPNAAALAGVKGMIKLLKDPSTPRASCVIILRRFVGLAMLPEFADKMVKKGLLPLLVRSISVMPIGGTMVGDGNTKELAAGLIRNLFAGGSIKAFEKNEWFEELVKSLLTIFMDGTSVQQYESGSAIGAIALNKEYHPIIVKEGGIHVCIAQLMSRRTIEGVRDKAALILRCLSATEANQREIGLEGGVEAFLKLLQNGTQFQRETSSAALNWLMEVQENRTILVKERGIRTLLNYVVRGQKFVRQQAISALGKLAPHSEFQVPLAQAGVMGPCIAIMETGNDSQKTAACQILLAVANTEAMANMRESIPCIVKVYLNGTQSQKSAAKQVLEQLSRHKDFRHLIVRLVGADSHLFR
ncbi:Aste57867_20457 [Aphanomyces stellatus]|uniref:Aste57867_20457 protein n=1 Tax=Aphanomyces stellatus TaxID=120398 RepID=A0A485LF55_9STRA|nr:hypothetical protein As57867_020391 [Aphanomyces stellatus]VFT97143.1 Aste57867_20457 [Aphanomyces stellatus]